MIFLYIFLSSLCVCHIIEYMVKPEKLQNISVSYKASHLAVTLLNCIIQAILMDYFITTLEMQFTLNNCFNGMIAFVFQDVYFYTLHRFMHNKYVYKYFHKTHHFIKTPNFWSCYYEHPLDHIVVWVMPYIIITKLLKINYWVYWGYVLFSTILSIEGHSGNDLKFKYWYIGFFTKKASKLHVYVYNHATHHDLHHIKTNCNYGLWTTFMDRIFNTLSGNYDEYINEKIKTN